MCAPIRIRLRDSAVIRTARDCACGTVRFSSTLASRTFGYKG